MLVVGVRVRIIAFTANVMPNDPERCRAAGMDGFLSKPFKRAELVAALQAGPLAHTTKSSSLSPWT
jgi:CheY-like chemotaxis protein